MRILFLCIFVLGVLTSCATKIPQNQTNNELVFEENEEGDYEIIVLDTQYEYFLSAIAKPKNFHTENYYKNRNIIYVNEWNARHNRAFAFDSNLYEVYIDYKPQVDYGLEFEYRLFNFFKFIEWKYKVDLDRKFNRN